MSSRETLESGAVVAGYTIDRELGRGAMSTVYLAQDLKHRRPVALKLLTSGAAASMEASRFLREIEIVAGLAHPNILPLHDSGNAEGRLYYVMPFVEGGSLRQLIERGGPMAVAEAVRIAQAVADALACAHAQNVVHRDIKPENILFEHGHPVVADFGVARALSTVTNEYSTGAGVAVGTPSYMSPEQASGESNVDHRADQYALACVLYEMLAGAPPFTGANVRAIMARHLMDTPPPLATIRPGVPANVRQALSRALAKEPADRFASIAEFAEALSAPAPERGSSIAVLPFANLSGDPADNYFGDGMAEEIITALAKVIGLRVASRTSSFALRDRTLDIRTIGEMLNVSAVLEGSVRRSGATLRVTAQLISVDDGHHLWSERFDREMKDVFAIHDDIAAAIVAALRLVLRDDERRAITKAPTVDLEAYDFYLRGRQFFLQRRKKSVIFARQMFTRAIQLDPAYARAHAGLADASAMLAHHYQDAYTEENLQQADQASQHALALDPDLAEAHAARGFTLALLQRFGEAEEEFARAIALDPKQFEARYFHARACFQRGELERALELFQEASDVRDDHEALYFAAQTLTAMNRAKEADAAYRRALPVIEHHLALNPDDARAITMAAVCCSRLGQRDAGIAWAKQASEVDPEDASVCYNVACLLALEGERDDAIAHLERAFRVGFARRDWIERDPDLDSLRDDPRFVALLSVR